jgi:hypothetical protein
LEDRLKPKGVRARALLKAYGIPIVDHHYSATALERALAGVNSLPDKRAAAPSETAFDPVDVLRDALSPAGVQVITATKSKGWHITVAAAPDPRLVMTVEFDGDINHPCPPIAIGSDPVRARLYFVRTRHSGGAYFVASKLDDTPELHFFVLLSESRVWVAGRDVLYAFLTEDRKHGSLVDEKTENVRTAVFDKAPSALRVWFPKGDTSFDLEVQLRDEHREPVLRRERGF